MTENGPDIPRKIPPGALEALLEADGIALPGKGTEREIHCFLPHHDDKHASMSVNVARGKWYCHACNFGGDAWTYLTKVRKWTPEVSKQTLLKMGWIAPSIEASKRREKEKADRRAGITAKFHKSPPKQIKMPDGRVAKCIMEHEYRLAGGRLACLRLRYEKLNNAPKVRSFTPAPSRRGWWGAAPHKLPKEDGLERKLPLYRLPDLLRMAGAGLRDRAIWIVEGEKCVDFVLGMKDAPERGIPPTTCLFGGEYDKPSMHDLEPLRGRKCFLVADTDAKGRRVMEALAREIEKRRLNCEIELCLPEGEGGYDVADAIAEGGYEGMMAWIEKCGTRTWRPPWESRLNEFLARLLPGTRAVEPERVLAECGLSNVVPDARNKEFKRVIAAARKAGWEYRRMKRKRYRDKTMFERKKPRFKPKSKTISKSQSKYIDLSAHPPI